MGWMSTASAVAKVRRSAARVFRGIVCLGSALVFLAGADSAAWGEGYCAECMQKALDNHSKDTLASIENAWERYQHVLETMRRIEASGTPEQKAKARELAARAEAAWKPYESMARNYASPEYAAQLAAYQSYLREHLEQTREKIHKETNLYAALAKTTLEEQRQRVLKDMAGFRDESDRLKKTFQDDAWLSAFSAGTTYFDMRRLEQLDKLKSIKGWEEFAAAHKAAFTRRANVIAKIERDAAIGGGLSRNATEFRKALTEGDSGKEMASAVQLVADTGLTAIRAVLAAKPALAATVRTSAQDAAAGAGLVQIVAPTLDCVLLAQAFHERNKAEERIVAIDTLEQTWHTRIKAAGNELHATERRLKLAETEMAYQKKIAEVYARVAAAKKD